MKVAIDWSVPQAFLEAFRDGEITTDEAEEIARLPANREMLRSVCEQRALSTAAVSEQTLAYLITRAGSTEPLDRLWKWLNPVNDFGYAELAVNPVSYGQLIAGLEVHHQSITDTALCRVAPFLPPEREIDETFALTVGCVFTDWATEQMSGTNVLWTKSGWQDLVRRIAGAIYRRQLLAHWPERSGGAEDGEAALIEMLTYTVVQGAGDHVGQPSAPDADPAKILEGADLIDRCVAAVHGGSDLSELGELLEHASGEDGPLRALGRSMVRRVAEQDGDRALTRLLEQGVGPFLERVLTIDGDRWDRLLDRETVVALRGLSAPQSR
jgi:hypothetical protein